MMDWLRVVVQYVLTPVVTIAAVAYVCRAIVEHGLRLHAERAKSDLEKAAALAIERVRSDATRELDAARHTLAIDLERQRARYGRLQEERVAPLLKLYARIARLASAAEHLQTILRALPESDVSDDVRRLEAAVQSAQCAYLQALLFLPGALADQIDALITGLRDAELYGHGH